MSEQSVRIRAATPRDGDAIAEIYAPAVTESATSFEIVPPDAGEMAARVAGLVPRFPWLVCERNGALLGYAYAGPHRARAAYSWSAEVSAYVHRNAWRAGVGRALYTSLLATLAELGFYNAYAGATLPNDASVALHESIGFHRIGVFHAIGYKQNTWHDVIWMERRLRPYDAPAGLPKPFAELSEAERERLCALGLPYLHLR